MIVFISPKLRIIQKQKEKKPKLFLSIRKCPSRYRASVRKRSQINGCKRWVIITQLALYLRLVDQLELAVGYVGVGEHNVSFNNLGLISFTNTFFQGTMIIGGIYQQ